MSTASRVPPCAVTTKSTSSPFGKVVLLASSFTSKGSGSTLARQLVVARRRARARSRVIRSSIAAVASRAKRLFVALAHDPGDEALTFRDPLDLDRHRFHALLQLLQASQHLIRLD